MSYSYIYNNDLFLDQLNQKEYNLINNLFWACEDYYPSKYDKSAEDELLIHDDTFLEKIESTYNKLKEIEKK